MTLRARHRSPTFNSGRKRPKDNSGNAPARAWGGGLRRRRGFRPPHPGDAPRFGKSRQRGPRGGQAPRPPFRNVLEPPVPLGTGRGLRAGAGGRGATPDGPDVTGTPSSGPPARAGAETPPPPRRLTGSTWERAASGRTCRPARAGSGGRRPLAALPSERRRPAARRPVLAARTEPRRPPRPREAARPSPKRRARFRRRSGQPECGLVARDAAAQDFRRHSGPRERCYLGCLGGRREGLPAATL